MAPFARLPLRNGSLSALKALLTAKCLGVLVALCQNRHMLEDVQTKDGRWVRNPASVAGSILGKRGGPIGGRARWAGVSIEDRKAHAEMMAEAKREHARRREMREADAIRELAAALGVEDFDLADEEKRIALGMKLEPIYPALWRAVGMADVGDEEDESAS